MTNVLVTVGTTRFDDLVSVIFSREFQKAAENIRVTEIVLQYGQSNLPSKTLDHIHLSTYPYIFKEMPEYIKAADIIISHCGSGTALDVIRGPIFQSEHPTPTTQRPPPRLILVPNPTLMDNHQNELAEELGKLGCAQVASIQNLPIILGDVTLHSFTTLEKPNNNALHSIINSLLKM